MLSYWSRGLSREVMSITASGNRVSASDVGSHAVVSRRGGLRYEMKGG